MPKQRHAKYRSVESINQAKHVLKKNFRRHHIFRGDRAPATGKYFVRVLANLSFRGAFVLFQSRDKQYCLFSPKDFFFHFHTYHFIGFSM